ncbi:hypothetical protein HN51_040391 [Arachis hypogaea]
MGTNLYPSSSLLGQSKDAARFLFWKFILQFINLFVGFCSFLLSIHSPLLEITTRVWFKQQQCNVNLDSAVFFISFSILAFNAVIYAAKAFMNLDSGPLLPLL